MSYLFALLYLACFIVAVVFLIKTLLDKKNGKDTNKDKIIAIVSFVLFIVFFILTGITNPVADEKPSNSPSAVENDIKQSEKSDEQGQPKQEAIEQDDNNTETTPTNTTVESTNTEVSDDVANDQDTIDEDLSIIVRDGHPKYYGSVEKSHEVWDDVEKGKVHFGDKSYGHSDKPILAMTAYRNEDMIRSVVVSFTNFVNNPNLSVDEVIPIVASYMPYDVMDKWYEYRGSEHIVSDDGSKADYYVVSYGLTDKGSDAYYSKEHSYSGSIDVIIEVKDDIVQYFNITFGKPRWMTSLSKNNYHTEEWTCNLYDYKQ